MKVGNVPVAVVDATIVESAVRPRRQIEVVAPEISVPCVSRRIRTPSG